MATKQQFVDFLTEIEPKQSTVDSCSSAHTTLRDKLKNHETFKSVHSNTFLSGSYTRNTAIRPKTVAGQVSRPDVDIIVVTLHTRNDEPSEVIDQLYNALSDCGYQNLRKNRRSVSVLNATVDMDVVPIIPSEGADHYWIPDKEEGLWIRTNPPGHTEWATKVNKEADGRFKPLVKMLKWWKRENLPDLRRPKGFILEALVAARMSYTETGYEALLEELFNSVKNSYSLHVALGVVPHLEDPAVPGNNVFSAVKFEEFKEFYDLLCAHAALIAEARAETDTDKQLAKWREVFGRCFPAAGGTTKAAASLLLPAAAAAGLSFPARAVTPNKPQGFA